MDAYCPHQPLIRTTHRSIATANHTTPHILLEITVHAFLPADEQTTPRKRTFRKFTYRGIDLEQLLDLSSEQFMELVHCRARRRFQRGLKRKPMGLIKKLRAAKKNAAPGEKPEVVKTHLRNMIIVPEMIGSVIGIYNGKVFNQVEIKPEMTGHYLAEFSISYKPVKHGRPGIGATHSSKFVPLK
ncbi:ribosomal protein S19-domain-containing protein [Mucor lusitanicus]|uniref:Ribosomal protein S19-domain-containing protein n=2 Tax=Mucor circinelloides f. lusitanicus TaxID=29924 RepID=A0A8H4BL01_MUCCL|nr:ribosomal protein S19-domain-containing protein [Mucor lusitanicus]